MANVDILTNTTFHTEMAKVREVIEKGVGGGGGASLPDDVINNKHFVDSMEELAAEMDKNTGADLPIDNQLLVGSPNAIANAVVKAKFDEVDDELDELSQKIGSGDEYAENEAVIGKYFGKPLYRKCFKGTIENGAKLIDASSLNIETVVSQNGTFAEGDSQHFIPTFAGDMSGGIKCYYDGRTGYKSFAIYNTVSSWVNAPYTLFVTYTKTTD